MIFAKIQLKGNYFCCNFVTMERIAFLVTMGPITECSINFQYYFSAIDLSTEYHCIWANMLCLLLGWLTKTANRSLKFPPHCGLLIFGFLFLKGVGLDNSSSVPAFFYEKALYFGHVGSQTGNSTNKFKKPSHIHSERKYFGISPILKHIDKSKSFIQLKQDQKW